MPAACLLIRDLPHYRREAFEQGLKAVGYTVTRNAKPAPGNVLICWNRYGTNDHLAAQYERAGGHVLVAENGYLPTRDEHGRQLYAVSRGQHHHGGVTRKASAPFAMPWRAATETGHILVCGQRGIGSPLMASPPFWAERTTDRLAVRTRRPVRIRKHPGKDAPAVPLERDLEGCHAVVIWSSNAGIGALLAGVPVFYAAPRWIAEKAALPLAGADLEKPFLGDRSAGLANAAANQWSVAEIERGEPFRCLLFPARQTQGAAAL